VTRPTAPAHRIEIVRDLTRLAEIGPAWEALRARIGGAIFQSHGWISAWWRTAPDRRDRGLHIALAWQGEALQAVLPLATHRRRGLVFLEWAANSHSDYGDLLAGPDCPDAVLHDLWAALGAARGFDIALVNRLLPEARAHVLGHGGAGLRLSPNHRSEVSHRVTGWTDGRAWFEGQSKKARQNHRRGWKFLEENGPVRFRLLDPDEDRATVLERLAALKRKWLAAQGHVSTLFDAGAPALAALVDVLAQAGILRLFVLECGDKVIAVSVNFVQRDTMMAFVTTYDPDFERASPGTLLMSEYIKWSFDQGLKVVDFLCGAEAFKTRFATEAVTLTSLAAAGSLKGRLALAADEAQRALRAWRERQAPNGDAQAAA